MSNFTLDVQGMAPIAGTLELDTPAIRPELWFHLEDREVFGALRSCVPCPAVFVLWEDPHAVFEKQWQLYTRAINHNMSVQHVAALFGSTRWAFNGTGFPGRHDYLTGVDADQKDPNTDKVRTCARNVLAGNPSYSFVQALKDVGALVMSLVRRRQSVRMVFATLTTNNVLDVLTFDSRLPPPLKPGRSYPGTVEQINPDDYLYMPESHPWFFVVANIVNEQGDVVPFPNGALYSWTGDNMPYSFLPLVSNHGYGSMLYPLARLRKLAPDEPVPSPYRRT